jgi:hypothetical protein
MDPRPNKHSAVHFSLMPLLVGAIFWALILAVCPELHQWIHPDADHEDHDCAVTLFSNSGIDFTAVDLSEVGKLSRWLFLDLLHLDSQVLVSTQAERLIPIRGPPQVD